MRIAYERLAGGGANDRIIRPFGLFFWGAKWTLTAWCELRTGYRTFRLDHVHRAEITGDEFREEPDRNLADFLARIGRRAEAR